MKVEIIVIYFQHEFIKETTKAIGQMTCGQPLPGMLTWHSTISYVTHALRSSLMCKAIRLSSVP